MNFFDLLNSKNSDKISDNEYIIKIPVLDIDDTAEINQSCKISSNCNTLIKCKTLNISASDVSISNINFEGGVLVKEADNFKFTNSIIKKSKENDGSVTINSSRNVILSHITISETFNIPGLYLKLHSQATADNLLIHDLSESLLVCNSGSSISVKDSTFHHSKANGLFSGTNEKVEIENSSFSYIEYPGIYLERTQCVIRNCQFKNIMQDAIAIHYSPNFSIEKSTFSKIKGSAISASDKSEGKIVENVITDVEGNGIYVKMSNVDVTKNKVSKSVFPGIAVILESTGKLFGNEVSDFNYNGIVCRSATNVTIENSKINNVKESGISISDTPTCYVKNNKITNCSIAGIEAYGKSNVTVTNNIISSVDRYAFLVYTSGYMKCENNVIQKVGKGMAKIAFKGSGDFINNKVTECTNQFDILQTSSPFLFANNGSFKGATNDPEKVTSQIEFLHSDLDENILCLKCGKNQRDCYIFDCGHKVYCKACAEDALKKKENCPLCRFPIVKVSEGFNVSDDNKCVICLENQPDCIILPCGHMGVCSECMKNWFKNKHCCPVCRAENSVFRVIINDI